MQAEPSGHDRPHIMHYAFSETEQAFQVELRRFAAKKLAPHYQSDDEAGVMRPTLLSDMASVGLTGLRIPEEFGGQQATSVVAGLAAEEVGRADFNATYVIINTCLVADIMVRHADHDRQAVWLPPIAAGQVVPALLLTEPDHGSDAAAMECRAIRDGDGWVITGEKTSITFGLVAPMGLVMARTGGAGARGVSAFYVPLDHPAVTRSGFDDLGGRSIGRASMFFDGL
ncbi:MAG: acyl-CoA dehydrogenase family protein, partial [Acidimicrobiia bacterium]|nr:acyl-CoA dehydrogenase family protein [Acidimicrobiia bacterium]